MEDIRDYALIAGFVSLTALTLLVLILVSLAGYLSFRVLEFLNRFTENKMVHGLTKANTYLKKSSESGPHSLLEIIIFGFSMIQWLRKGRSSNSQKKDYVSSLFFPR